MGIAIVILIIVAIGLVRWGYGAVLKQGIRNRHGTTALTPDQVRQLFDAKVATLGWSIVDDDNPRVAQSPLISGMRQQIGLRVDPIDQGSAFEIVALRYVERLWGTPAKAHTMRMRMNSFVRAVRAADPRARIEQ